MSEYFTGVTFPWQPVTPSDDAIIRRAVLNDGILTGCAISYSGYTLTMGAGTMIMCGRQFRHTATQNWAVTGATSGYARLVLTIDTTRTSTKETFDQIVDSIQYASSVNGFPALTTSDINQAGTTYQIAVATVALGAGGITKIVSKLGNGSKFRPVDWMPDIDDLEALFLGTIDDSAHTINSGGDLNSYVTPGAYRCATYTIAESLKNMPDYKASGFRLIVSATSTNIGRIQLIIFNTVSTPRLYWRLKNENGAWSEWFRFASHNVEIRKTLWTGSWASGSVTVPDTSKYSMFLIALDGLGSIIPAFRYSTHIRGIGGFASDTPTLMTYHFTATFEGNEWTLVQCNALQHNQNGPHAAFRQEAVASIIGLV